jgi:prolipoprotein diacylglyceryltransferase
MDRIVIVVALSGFFIRMGNLMNSEIYGNITTLPWGFYFLRSVVPAEAMRPRHPTQIYEALSYLAIFVFLINYYYRKNGAPSPGFLFGMFLILVFGIRLLIEFLKVPQVGFERDMALNMGQFLSIPFILAGFVIVCLSLKGKFPGTVTGKP